MMKKAAIISALIVIFLMLCGCSRESKMGFGEFTDRLYSDYKISLDPTSSVLQKSDGYTRLYCKTDYALLVCRLGNNDNITGIALMLTKENEGKIYEFADDFQKYVCVFTMQSPESVKTLFRDIGFTADKIKFTDGNSFFTVGKYKYSLIGNESNITLFCERI